MAEEDEQDKDIEEGPEAAEVKGAGKKWFLIGGVVLVLLIVLGGAGAYFFMSSDVDKVEDVDSALVTDGEESFPEGYLDEDEFDEDEEPLGAIFPMERFIVNLSGGEHFMRVHLQLEFVERDVPRRFRVKQVPIRDAILKLLMARTYEDVKSVSGREALRDDISETINTMLRKELVKAVYYTNFVVQ